MFVLVFLSSLFLNIATAFDENIDLYVDITHIYAPDGSKGTSTPLNILVSNQAQNVGSLEHRFHRILAPDSFRGNINVYDWTNIAYKPGWKKCNYRKAVACGVQNNHWTLQTVVTVGDKFSTVTMKIYNAEGRIVANGSKTSWGTIRWVPQWKLTKIKESGGMMGPKETEIFEMWPPKMEELPPLITNYHVHQATQSVYLSLNKNALD